MVRVGDTVRRPQGSWSPSVHALLRHFAAAGFDGAPRFLGIDDEGREVLSYVEGNAALEPAPAGDDVLVELGALLRRAHDAQDGFEPPADAEWCLPGEGSLICHNDVFPPNVIFRDGQPVALVDWDLAWTGRSPRRRRLGRLLLGAAPARRGALGPPERSRPERARLRDADGLETEARAEFVERALAHRRRGYELHRRLGGKERVPGWREMWDRGSGPKILANARLIEELRPELEDALRRSPDDPRLGVRSTRNGIAAARAPGERRGPSA